MPQGSNRRHFLQTTGAGIIGAGFFSSLEARQSQSPNEKIRFAAIGVTGKGTSDTASCKKAGDVVAICDADETKLNTEGEKKYASAKRFFDYRNMFDRIEKKKLEIDAFTVSTPDHMHAVIAARGMKMGKHCFCQKPLTHDIYEARKLAEIAVENKVATQMGNQGTSANGLRKGVALVQSGILGTIQEVHVWTNRPVWPQGDKRPDVSPAPEGLNWDVFLGTAPYRPYGEGYHPFAWRGRWDFGTGALGDMACHTFNMPYWAVDLRDPTTVQATTSGHDRDSYPKWSEIAFEFPATDKRPAVKVFWYDGGKRPPQSVYDGSDIAGCMIVGDKAKLYAPDDYAETVKVIGSDEPKVKFEQSPGHFEEFVDAIRGGAPAKSNFPGYSGKLTETILLGNLAVYAANEAGTPGKKIEWDAAKMIATNAPEVQHIVKREYRPGYSL